MIWSYRINNLVLYIDFTPESSCDRCLYHDTNLIIFVRKGISSTIRCIIGLREKKKNKCYHVNRSIKTKANN